MQYACNKILPCNILKLIHHALLCILLLNAHKPYKNTHAVLAVKAPHYNHCTPVLRYLPCVLLHKHNVVQYCAMKK